MKYRVLEALFSTVSLSLVLLFSMAVDAQPDIDNTPFKIRAYHQHIFPDRQSMTVFHQRLEDLAALDYNMVVFGMGNPSKSTITMHKDGSIRPIGCTTADMRKLVAHAVKLGLEPVFELKFIGKQIPLVYELLDDHPNLVINSDSHDTVLNAAYRMPDGRDAYSATALALVDYLLNLYPTVHPARYFHFGIDEFDADDMATLAKKLYMNPAQAFAYCLNLGTDFVLARGVTPIIWGDVLLSPELAKKDCGITIPGFKADQRHALSPGGAYHSSYKSEKISLHTMVNYLRDRDEIIVADWHYWPSPIDQFPSIDYFQSLGFKDVWGCPWHNPVNLHQFCRYAALRQCGGMMATAWNMAYLATERLRLRFIMQSSSAYFHKPFLKPPVVEAAKYTVRGSEGVFIADEKRTGVVLHNDRELTFHAPVMEKIQPKEAVLLLVSGVSEKVIEQPLIFDAKKNSVSAKLSLSNDVAKTALFILAYGYTDSESGFFLHKNCSQGLALCKEPPVIPETEQDVLLQGTFSGELPMKDELGLWAGGQCAAPIVVVSPRKPVNQPRPNGLDSSWFDKVWVYPSDYFNHALCDGMEIDIKAKMIGDFTGDAYCALLSKGSFHSGFRVLVHQTGRLLFQMAGLDNGKPLNVTSSGTLPKNKWVKIRVVYHPPKPNQSGAAYILIDGQEQGRRPVTTAMQPSAAVLGIGCELKEPAGKPKNKMRPNFPGSIRSFSVRSATSAG